MAVFITCAGPVIRARHRFHTDMHYIIQGYNEELPCSLAISWLSRAEHWFSFLLVELSLRHFEYHLQLLSREEAINIKKMACYKWRPARWESETGETATESMKSSYTKICPYFALFLGWFTQTHKLKWQSNDKWHCRHRNYGIKEWFEA